MLHRTAWGRSVLSAVCFALVAGCSADTPVAPDGPLTVYKIAGDRQIGIAGQPLLRALQIQVWSGTRQVQDAAFSVEVTGGGSVDAGSRHTDRIGNAMLRWTLGETDGNNLLAVRVAGAEPKTFTATAVAVAPENVYHYRSGLDEQRFIGLADHGQFVAGDSRGCSGKGRYEISGATITFVVLATEPGVCPPLPELTGSIDETAIVFELKYYDDWDNDFTELQTYSRGAP
ncbi:hypothetical protein BH23GEM2_BH23GEM2_19960 [soil metagenome]